MPLLFVTGILSLPESFRIVVNKMPQVRDHVEAETAKSVTAALKVGEQAAKDALTPGHGVDTGAMKAGITTRMTGKKEGEIVNPAFYGRFVEYGTTFMGAIPHMRPAARKMGDEFKRQMKSNLGKIR
jgi:HK97 gp10 family phage protein